ncbi:hypothetical protein A0H81_12840 [Grifola frondosa]|uniref:Uncharacterized protein n=1 Tax=Grifola frondosa TaxID=5627 RepID=A0A1C7LQM9_GRIFR|nr:hypothetical protein A0H81_12840 [Grifola frondosa]
MLCSLCGCLFEQVSWDAVARVDLYRVICSCQILISIWQDSSTSCRPVILHSPLRSLISHTCVDVEGVRLLVHMTS